MRYDSAVITEISGIPPIGDRFLSVRLIKDTPFIPEPASDWFLPSKDELQEIYNELVLSGLLPALDSWWSSSEYDATRAYYMSFEFGTFNYTNKIGNDLGVYAARKFTAAIGAYSLRNIGPAGGRIFYINGTTYYELYMTELDLSDHYHWSNIALLIGTGTAIGTGAANTLAIINQAGHIGSAALLCHDLVT